MLLHPSTSSPPQGIYMHTVLVLLLVVSYLFKVSIYLPGLLHFSLRKLEDIHISDKETLQKDIYNSKNSPKYMRSENTFVIHMKQQWNCFPHCKMVMDIGLIYLIFGFIQHTQNVLSMWKTRAYGQRNQCFQFTRIDPTILFTTKLW